MNMFIHYADGASWKIRQEILVLKYLVVSTVLGNYGFKYKTSINKDGRKKRKPPDMKVKYLYDFT